MEEAEKPKSTSPQAGDKYIVRFPEGMRERIADAAKASNRSMNAEIIDRLDRSFAPGEAHVTADQMERLLKAVNAQQQTVKLLGSMLQAVAGAPVDNRTAFGKSVADKFVTVGGLFSEGKIAQAYDAFDDVNKMLGQWSETPEGAEARKRNEKRFPRSKATENEKPAGDAPTR